MRTGLGAMFPTVVAGGLVISEDTDVTNALDVSLSTGSFVHEDFAVHTVAAAILSRTVNLVRWYHVGGAWVTDTDAEIDPTKYDDGSDLQNTAANQYYKSAFYTDGTNIHWVYPLAGYATVAQAIGAPPPTAPDALAHQPACTAVVMKGNDAAFPTAGGERWIDIRPRLGVASPATVESHDSLSGVSADDHHVKYLDAEALAAAKAGAGISDDDLVQVDGPGAGAPADGEYAKWTANGLEGRSTAEVMGDLGFTATAAEVETAVIEFIIDGGGAEIALGIHGDLEIPFACTIQRVTMLADQTGSIVVDIWMEDYANYPPTDADSITAAAVPTIGAAVKSQDSTLSGWTTAIPAGETLRYNCDSVTDIERVTIALKVVKT
jgi:hypothetical protein